jgi:hypothetical protein
MGDRRGAWETCLSLEAAAESNDGVLELGTDGVALEEGSDAGASVEVNGVDAWAEASEDDALRAASDTFGVI